MSNTPQPDEANNPSSTTPVDNTLPAPQQENASAPQRSRMARRRREKTANDNTIPTTANTATFSKNPAAAPSRQSQRQSHHGSAPNETDPAAASEPGRENEIPRLRGRTRNRREWPLHPFSIFQPLRPPRKRRPATPEDSDPNPSHENLGASNSKAHSSKPTITRAEYLKVFNLLQAGGISCHDAMINPTSQDTVLTSPPPPRPTSPQPQRPVPYSDSVSNNDPITTQRLPRLNQPACIPPSSHLFPLTPGVSLLQYSSLPVATAETVYLPQIRKLISTDLSEPYSIYVYRYFLYQWASLCYMVIDDATGEMIGVVVSKLEVHRGGPLRGYIAMLATKEAWRGRGVATRLVAESVDEMIRGDADEVALETEVSNTASLKLYEKLGFLRSKRLHRYYLNGNTAFRLLLYLKQGTAAKETFPPDFPQQGPEDGDVQGYIPT